MPHSTFRNRHLQLSSGVAKCPCGQTFDYESDRDQEVKIRMHNKFCDRLGDPKIKRQPRKAMTLKDFQRMKVERRQFRE